MAMLNHRHIIGAVMVTTVSLLLAGGSLGAQSVSSSDLQRLEASLNDVTNDIDRLRSRDQSLASRLERELADLRDEIAYLRVKLRREGTVDRRDYTQLRDDIDQLANRARGRSTVERYPGTTGTTGTRVPPAPPGTGGYDPLPPRTDPPRTGGYDPLPPSSTRNDPYTLDVGQQLDVRLQTGLTSRSAQVEDRFEATTIVDLYKDERLLVPAGSIVRGIVTSVDRATRMDRKGSITVAFDQLIIDRRRYDIRATVLDALESEGIKGEAGRIGTAAGVGAVIGGIIGGVKGALIGILIGGGGTIAATEGKDVELLAGTILRIQLDSPVMLGQATTIRSR